MDYEEQLKLQAYLDGELPEAEAREVANWLARDQGAVALLGELRNTRKAVTGFEDGIRLPESREFYWGKIQRQIERPETPAPAPEARISFLARFRRVLIPAAALTLLALVGLLAIRQGPSPNTGGGFETALADSGSFTYRDDTLGTTLVWFSYPADNEVAQDDEMGTLE